MPIRMEKDDPKPGGDNERRNNDNSGGGGGMGGLANFLPFILMFLFKKPKFLMIALALGAVWYFFLGGSEMFQSTEGGESAGYENTSDFQFGASLSEEEYAKADVYEPLSTSYGASSLPPAVSLEQYAPTRQHQGRQGSCVGWASAYGARTILQARATGKNPNSTQFSPSFLYNQIALRGCQGAYMNEAMESMSQVGALPFSQFQYDDRSCSDKPDRSEQNAAQPYKIKGYTRLTYGDRNMRPDVNGIKQHLAQGAPVVIGMMVGGSFMHDMVGKTVWQPTRSDYNQSGFGGHAMCVIGYDDSKYGGAFRIMNSWGMDWGDKGMVWVTYKDFDFFTKEAYGLFPMGSAQEQKKFDPNKLEFQFGLLDNATQKLIPLVDRNNRIFQTSRPIRKGDKFKVAITNSIECYTYVLGMESDGSSYVLFPYTDQHSAYCGIVGTRVFPKDYSMTADQVGNQDYIAVVVSKTELDYQQLNNRMNAATGSYAAKLKSTLAGLEVADVKFKAGESVVVDATLQGKNVVGMIVAIDKQ